MTADGLRITTWNVNSIRKRLAGLERLVEAAAPDVLCLQETKVRDPLFPTAAARALGFEHVAVHGEGGYNGVAILSRRPLLRPRNEPRCDRPDCRHLHAAVDLGGTLGEVEIHNVYVPAGGDIPDPKRNPKFAYKLEFLRELGAWWGRRRDRGRPMVALGDFNVAPLETDVWSHARLRNVVTHTEVEIRHLAAVQSAAGWVDAVREIVPPAEHLYTWWSYRAPDWAAADKGRRLDHVWLTPDLQPALRGAEVLRAARGWPEPSDHVPVTVTLSL